MEIIHHHFESLSSTNDWAKEALKKMGPHTLLLVTAATQTAGRGQYGRNWSSPKGENLYLTFAFVSDQTQDPVALTHVLALSIASVLKSVNIESQIKKPNDLLVDGRKIAGILCETQNDQKSVALGLGLNINMSETNLKEIGRPATSILVETGEYHSLEEVLYLVKEHFIPNLELFLKEGFDPFKVAFENLLLS